MTRPPFLVPRLMWDLSIAPTPTVAVGRAPWLGGVIEGSKDLERFLSILDRLILALNVAGYEVDDISLALRSGGFAADPQDWLFLPDLATMQFLVEPRGWAATQALPVPLASEAAVALSMRPRRMFQGRDPSYARPMQVTAQGFDFEEVTMRDGTRWDHPETRWDHALDTVHDHGHLRVLQLALKRPTPPAAEEPSRFLTWFLSALADSVDHLTSLIAFDLLHGAAAWMDFPTQEDPHGLLGAYDPNQWTFPGERWSPPAEVEIMRTVGRDLWRLVFPSAAGLTTFLHDELFDVHAHGSLIAPARGMRSGPFNREFEHAVQVRCRDVYGVFLNLKNTISRRSWVRALMAAHTLGAVDILGTVGVGVLSGSFDATPADRVEFDATGWYESRNPDPQRSLPRLVPIDEAYVQTVQLNQAGGVLTGFWQTRSTDPASGLVEVVGHRLKGRAASRPDDLTVVTIGSDLYEAIRHEYTFERTLTSTSAPPVTGRLVIEQVYKKPARLRAGDELVHEVGMTVVYDDPANDPHGGVPPRFVRTSPRSHLSSEAISSLGSEHRPRVEALQRRPLHAAEVDAWTAAVGVLIDRVRTYLLLDDPVRKRDVARQADGQLRAAAARHVELSAVGTILRDNGQFLVVRELARQELAGRTITVGLDTRTAFAWLNEVVLGESAVTAGIRGLLDLEPIMLAVGGPRPWTYRWRAELAGLELDVPWWPLDPGGFGGRFTISKIERASGRVLWTKVYAPTAWLCGVGPSVGVLLALDTSGDIEWGIDWSWVNFEGEYDITGVSGGITPFGGGSYSKAVITLRGDLTLSPPVSGNASGFTSQIGLHIGGGFAYLTGSLSLVVPEVPPAPSPEDIEAKLGRSVQVGDPLERGLPFFAVGRATLTPEGWLALAEVCADHRAALESPWPRLKLMGHASTTAGDDVNLPLSADRAANTYDAVRALLGPAFAVAEAGTFIGHRGEYDALLEIPDNTEDPEWRRVDLWFHSSMLVRL